LGELARAASSAEEHAALRDEMERYGPTGRWPTRRPRPTGVTRRDIPLPDLSSARPGLSVSHAGELATGERSAHLMVGVRGDRPRLWGVPRRPEDLELEIRVPPGARVVRLQQVLPRPADLLRAAEGEDPRILHLALRGGEDCALHMEVAAGPAARAFVPARLDVRLTLLDRRRVPVAAPVFAEIRLPAGEPSVGGQLGARYEQALRRHLSDLQAENRRLRRSVEMLDEQAAVVDAYRQRNVLALADILVRALDPGELDALDRAVREAGGAEAADILVAPPEQRGGGAAGAGSAAVRAALLRLLAGSVIAPSGYGAAPDSPVARLTSDAYGDPAWPAEEGGPDGDGTPLPPLAGARIWCPRDGAARVGSAVPVRFAIAAVPGADPDVPPLAEPVALRVLLESDAAAVRPVTRRTELRRDRTSEAVEFAVVPEQAGSAVLLFSVYRDRDGQLLQQVSAELPVGEAESDRTGAEVG